MTKTAALVDGRYVTMQLTGVQRYSAELVGHLPLVTDEEILVAVPPDRLIDVRDTAALAGVERIDRWHGGRGHAWEQLQLPRMVRRAGSPPLMSPASWGPVAVRRQAVYIHDVLPRSHGEYFRTGYRALFATLAPVLMRRCARVATPSGTVRDQLISMYRVPPGRLDVVPPGVGPPFADWPLGDLHARPGSYCVAVGSHDRRKNTRFLLEWWPAVRAELGLDLIVTTRGSSSVRFQDEVGPVAGVRVVVDPTDRELAELCAGAMCLLWPSVAEGYGLPLLEAMAVGTPFLSSDTGAARELAVDPLQVLPLEPGAWIEQLRRWRGDGLAELRRRSAETARGYTWERSAAAAWASLRAAGA